MSAIESVLRGWGIDPQWTKTRIGPLAAMNYDANDADVRANVSINGSYAEVWVYPHDLSAKLLGKSRVVESQDFPGDPEAQIHAFCQLLHELREAPG